jgi:hypothetical protein
MAYMTAYQDYGCNPSMEQRRKARSDSAKVSEKALEDLRSNLLLVSSLEQWGVWN